MEMRITWWKLKHANVKTKKINVEKLENTIIREKYSEKTTENYLGKQNFENPQEQWDHIIKSCLTAGEEILGVRLKEKHHDDVILEDLSNEQKLLKKSNRCMSRERKKARTKEK